jgi:type I restriction-modification system DNA methylase subunit
MQKECRNRRRRRRPEWIRSRDFEDREAYEKFLQGVLRRLNAGRSERLAEEREVLRKLPAARLPACKHLRDVRVSKGSLIRVERNRYSVPSRLIGEKVDLRLRAEKVEVYYGRQKIEEMPRLRGRGKVLINYRHIIDWLARKPGAFEGYRYRDELFPTSRFRMAYDTLAERYPATAGRRYVKISNHSMGLVFEELIRRFNEALDENPGEHFTPRDVVRLMASLILAEDRDLLKQQHLIKTVYDCCAGSGGMLTVSRRRMKEINPDIGVRVFGQKVNPETYAICKADMLIKSPDGKDAENIKYGSTLSNDRLPDMRFDYMLANPPYGKDWRRDKEAVEAEAERSTGRFRAGTPRINDGHKPPGHERGERAGGEGAGRSRLHHDHPALLHQDLSRHPARCAGQAAVRVGDRWRWCGD